MWDLSCIGFLASSLVVGDACHFFQSKLSCGALVGEGVITFLPFLLDFTLATFIYIVAFATPSKSTTYFKNSKPNIFLKFCSQIDMAFFGQSKYQPHFTRWANDQSPCGSFLYILLSNFRSFQIFKMVGN